MASSGPVPVNVLGSSASKTSKKSKPSSQFKFINRVDGFGQYARFAFSCKTLEEGNSVLSSMHTDKIFDNFISHAYSRNKDGQMFYVIHVVAHLCSRDFDFNFLRKRIPKASLHVTVYPDASYPPRAFKKPKISNMAETTLVAEGTAPNLYNNVSNASIFDQIATQEPLSF